MFYFIENEQITKNNIAGIKIIASIISKTILVFLNFFGRNQLSKIMVAKSSPINILMPKFSLATITFATVPPIHSKRQYVFNKLNNIFNIFKEYLINTVITSYKREA